MLIFAWIIFALSLGLLVYSYILYPYFAQHWPGKTPYTVSSRTSQLPHISILIAAYNEEKVIVEKLNSIFKGNYPTELLEVWIGSDNSTDNTNALVQQFANLYPQVKLETFSSRTGKPEIINQLVQKASHPLLILSDANVLFSADTIVNLARHFQNPKIGLVDTNMMPVGEKNEGIGKQEKTYIRHEVKTKFHEGRNWGTMMGPFGGCYAIRKSCYSAVPSHHLVDDFYICMRTLEQGYWVLNDLEAVVYEDVGNNFKDEFKRKTRIATGNFQNLYVFKHLILFKGWISFCWISHKIIRWLGPLLLILNVITTALLAQQYASFKWLLAMQFAIPFLVVLDFALRSVRIQIAPLKLVSHFTTTNLALLIGFYRSLFKPKSGTWTPTPRNQ